MHYVRNCVKQGMSKLVIKMPALSSQDKTRTNIYYMQQNAVNVGIKGKLQW